MFGNLPAHEKQAFFGILDEYFETRPHLLGAQQDGQSDYAAYDPPVAAAAAPTPVLRRTNPPPAPAARKPISPISSPATRTSGASISAGLNSGKSFGGMNTSSAGAAFGSLLKSNQNSKKPITPGEAVSGLNAITSAANRLNIGQNQQRRSPAPPPPPPVPSEVEGSYIGQAEVLYEYKGTEAEDLSVRKFDIINLVEEISSDWWKAEATDGSRRQGLVPSSYVKVI